MNEKKVNLPYRKAYIQTLPDRPNIKNRDKKRDIIPIMPCCGNNIEIGHQEECANSLYIKVKCAYCGEIWYICMAKKHFCLVDDKLWLDKE